MPTTPLLTTIAATAAALVVAAAPALGAPAPVEHRYRTMEVPDDPYYGTQWSLPTIGAVRAWDVTTGGAPGVRIAVIDSGVEAGHPDLAPNITGANPGETGNGREDNGIDDDGNGKVDDWRGWDFVGNDNDPQDTTPERHGTHVTGVIAARGDNGLGMAGVAWGAQVIPIRAIGSDGTGSESAIAGAIRYASERGARIVNASFGGDEFSQSISNAIADAPDSLFVVAAGNGGSDGRGDDNDTTAVFPCNLPLPNILCVTATDQADQLASFANRGATSVDLAAPGVNILSTTRTAADGYTYSPLSGTSFAAPLVAGTAALVLAANPGATTAQLRAAILNGVQPLPALAGKVASGGRLSITGALGLAPLGTPGGGGVPPPAAGAAPSSPTVDLPTVKVTRHTRPTATIRTSARRWFVSLKLGERTRASVVLERRVPALGKRPARFVVVSGVRPKAYNAGIRRIGLGALRPGQYRLRIRVTGSRPTILTRTFRVAAPPTTRGTTSHVAPGG